MPETGKKYVDFLKINYPINNMVIRLAGIGITSLLLIMLAPVYAEITEFTIEKNFYTNEDRIVFLGNEDQGNQTISVIVVSPTGKESMVVGGISNSEGSFKTLPKNIETIFSIAGTYSFTSFYANGQISDGVTIELEYDGEKVFQPTKPILQLNSISDKIVEIEKTITFTASIMDNSFTNVSYSLENTTTDLENTTTGATIEPRYWKICMDSIKIIWEY